MPAAANITVKKSDGTTDIVWTAIAASGGDKSPAYFRSDTATGTVGQKPIFSVVARQNAAGDVRRVDVSGSFPSVYTNASTGQSEVRSKMNFSGSFAVPQNITAADINEFSAQIPNLIASALIKATIAAGFAPT
ncbi:coat protein [ssRNA phage Gerhypos.1_28]|jgi:hypothetical protein|uniref:Coat protein n=2 Tax=Fiersviridae TaxID=2842319 RepID=A0A8S5L019_9VIRU|nr:coat protein [ssRNA phage Gerhypos.1_28]QDH87937.1 MAG: hypothetical protein H1Bulk29504_000002 [Leviviridae sp.]DAD51294.1 TPA_asm: coat protein [ssRNA phage Gerhypos.1_28]